MEFIKRSLLIPVLLCIACTASAIGWPANYEGVMLQAFSWDSYTDTQWKRLTDQADELSESFDLIWVPNSGRAGGHQNMGYMPQYWFTNHNSSFGTESALLEMISTYKEKGVGFIADVVVNHRNGVNSWTDFPVEEWNGRTWQLGPEHICSTDEVRNASGQPTPTGAPDTGEDFDGARDLDHTNATVQDNVKNYCKCLLEKYGYVGFRLDMVKGYGGQYTKIYNQYSRPRFSVGEYWDGQYDAVAAWIEATGRESAAFDFPGKYAINEAFHSNDLTKLVWKANGTTDQPAGLIHFGYPQLAVTFIDNHDTYRDGSKFNGNVLAANAFILCSPGTPCIFLAHWKAHKAALKQLIAVRKAAGIHNMSAVNVLKSSRDCYMAEVSGLKGKLVVRIGSTSDTPQGYTSADIKASGDGYCVWSKQGTGGDPIDPDPAMTIYYDNSVTNWTSVLVHYWGASESTWPGVNMSQVDSNIWKYNLPEGTIGVVFNNGAGAQTADVTDLTDNHLYRPTGSGDKPSCEDMGEYNGGDVTASPSQLYVLGNLKDSSWDTSNGVEMTKSDYIFIASNIEFTAPEAGNNCYFNLTTTLAADWDELNATADRYGSHAEGDLLAIGGTLSMVRYANNVNASDCKSWSVAPGTYDLVANFKDMTIALKAAGSAGVDNVSISQPDETPVYYNFQGVRIDNPGTGIYIVRRGDRVSKEYVR